MADHLDVFGSVADINGHQIGPPNMDPRVDITDVYAFGVKEEDDDEEDPDRAHRDADDGAPVVADRRKPPLGDRRAAPGDQRHGDGG